VNPIDVPIGRILLWMLVFSFLHWLFFSTNSNLFFLQRLNSYGVGRSYLIQDHDCHVQLPCNQPSFTEGNYVITEHLLGPNPFHPNNGNGTKYMGAMAFLVRIISIWGNIMKHVHLSGFQVFSGSNEAVLTERQSKFNEFDDFINKLENWRMSLPIGLSYSNENLAGQIKVGTTGAFVMMHVMWHTAMVYVHRYVRVVGVPKDYIEENIPKDFIVESIRKAFVHAEAVLQIMVHVQQRKNMVKISGEDPITVNAPFLGQAILDACHVALVRGELGGVRGELGGAQDRRFRVAVGLEWLKELKGYWRPLEVMYKKLKKKCRNFDNNTPQAPSAHGVPTPESSVDSVLPQSYLQYPANINNFPTTEAACINQSVEAPCLSSQFVQAQFADFLSPGISESLWIDAFGTETAQCALYNIAETEGGFPNLYPLPDHLGTDSAATFEDLSADAALPVHLGSGPSGHTSFSVDVGNVHGSDAADLDDPSDNEDDLSLDQKIHAMYFDQSAVLDGNLHDSESDLSCHSRRSSEIAAAKHDPMDVLSLLNNSIDSVTASLQNRANEHDEFTGPKGAAAPANHEMGGQPNLDNSVPN
jgi:hypothetical protein